MEWRGGPQILRTLALNFDFHGGGNFIAYRPPGRVERREGKDCLVGPYFMFDIDDRFAFDIDESVTLDLVFDGQTSTGFNLSYDHAVNPRAMERHFARQAGERWVHERVVLERARFANRKYEKTDLSIGAPNSKFPPGDYKTGHEIALCALTVSRSGEPVASASRGRLELDIVDENARPTTVRVGLYRDDGFAPLAGRDALPMRRFGESIRQLPLRFTPAAWPTPGRFVFYVDSRYSTELASGAYTLVISKGPEYRLIVREINIPDGGSADLDLALERWRDLPAGGWYSGDDHIHIARTDPSVDAAVLGYTRAEDVHVSNLLQMGNVSTSHFPQYAFGPSGHYSDGSYALVPGQESPRTSHRGHTIGLNGKRFHWPGDDYFLYDRSAEAIRADGGLFGYAHVALDAFNVAWGLALDVPLGFVDFLEMLQMNSMNTGYLYDFLNMGFRLLPSAGSDYPYIHVAGSERVYVKLDGEFSVPAWFEAWRTKRSFVSNGPIIEFTLNDDDTHNEFSVAKGQAVKISASAAVNPDYDVIDRLELVQQGNVVASAERNGGDEPLVLDHTFNATTSSWLALRAFGRGSGKAHTAPVYVFVDGNTRFHDRETVKELADRYIALLLALKDSRPTLDEEWERFNVEHDVLRKWDDDKPALDQRIDRAISIYRLLVDEAAGSNRL